MTRQQLSKYILEITLKDDTILRDSVFEFLGQYYTKRFGKKLSYGNPQTPEKVIELIKLNNCISNVDIEDVKELKCYLNQKSYDRLHRNTES